ncbi:uncharacterized protein LOC130698500 [Daphnia carinata]|uniref:uncharacterized protein LOC130698500 n=1 Tax=Daphnia carinata TaxID=120202 RepID=UPI00257F19F3|nr:uncharacterized protein LOC130698500 [Daphnia carinata]
MNDKPKPFKRVIVYEEFVDESTDVSDDDIREYGQRLGIDLTANPTLTNLVRDWILQPLPRYWFPCLDTRTGQWFYSNALNGQSIWHHPLEDIHRNLAKEYLSFQTIRERENPEGESSEQSMESGLSTKGFGGLSSSTMGGITPIKTPLPRTLAPLKRIPKIESTTNVLTTSPNPLPPFCDPTSPHSHSEQVRQVSFSTFKSSDIISSLLPGDLLFENRDRPTTVVAPFNHSILPVSTAGSLHSKLMGSKDDELTQQMKQVTVYPTSASRNLNPLTTDKSIVKELSISVSKCQLEPVAQQSKPRTSFTERLAAKKASQKLKSNESSESCLSNANKMDRTSAMNSEKRHVHFDLEPNHYHQYTPECSEENKATERSESSSSEDILDLVGDPEYLKPLTDVQCYPTAYEEKRWEVSFTSFGLASPNISPVKISTAFIDNEDSNEMVTRFNSEYCPSPLSASEKSDDADVVEDETTICPDNMQNEASEQVENCIPALETNLESCMVTNVLPEIEIHVPTRPDNAETLLSTMPFQPVREEVNEEKRNLDFTFAQVDKSNTSIANHNGKEVENIDIPPPIISPLKVEPQEIDDVLSVKLALENVTSKLVGSITRSESLEELVLANQVNPVIVQDVPVCPSPVQFITCETKSVESQNPVVQMDINLNSEQEASQLDLLLPPTSFSEIPQSVTQTEEVVADSSVKCNASDSRIAYEKTQSLEDWQTIKKEMESKLENEKKRLESWFASEIAQIKKQFENQLASERERTENLSKLVENAKSEKEQLAKREIVRLEETLAHLVEEKTRQVQTQVNNEVSQCNSSVLHRTVARQDANVQTEEPPILVSSLPMEQMVPLLKVDKIETTESNPSKNETYSRWESRDSPRRDSRIHCQCDNLQKQVARVEREMQLLKQKNLSFQKNVPTRKKSTPVKAQREPWWLDTDESATSTTSSVSDWRHSRGRSQSMTNLNASRDSLAGKKSTPIQRAREGLTKSQTPRRAWMEDLSTDQSSVDTPTSGISSAISTGEWDTVLSSIQKISGDLQEVWSHIGPRPRPLSYLSYQSPLWMPSSQSLMTNDRVPLHWSFSGSTAERTQALRLWLQQNKTQHSKSFL